MPSKSSEMLSPRDRAALGRQEFGHRAHRRRHGNRGILAAPRLDAIPRQRIHGAGRYARYQWNDVRTRSSAVLFSTIVRSGRSFRLAQSLHDVAAHCRAAYPCARVTAGRSLNFSRRYGVLSCRDVPGGVESPRRTSEPIHIKRRVGTGNDARGSTASASAAFVIAMHSDLAHETAPMQPQKTPARIRAIRVERKRRARSSAKGALGSFPGQRGALRPCRNNETNRPVCAAVPAVKDSFHATRSTSVRRYDQNFPVLTRLTLR